MNISRVLNSVYCDDTTVGNCPIPPLACCGIGIRFKYHRCQLKKKLLYFLSHSGRSRLGLVQMLYTRVNIGADFHGAMVSTAARENSS